MIFFLSFFLFNLQNSFLSSLIFINLSFLLFISLLDVFFFLYYHFSLCHFIQFVFLSLFFFSFFILSSCFFILLPFFFLSFLTYFHFFFFLFLPLFINYLFRNLLNIPDKLTIYFLLYFSKYPIRFSNFSNSQYIFQFIDIHSVSFLLLFFHFLVPFQQSR